MKRILILLCVAGLLAAIPLSHVAVAAKKEKAPKVEVCHVNSANDILDLETVVVVFGKVIEVSPNALPALEAQGDSTEFFTFTKEDREYWEEYYGISLPNADCLFLVE